MSTAQSSALVPAFLRHVSLPALLAGSMALAPRLAVADDVPHGEVGAWARRRIRYARANRSRAGA
jgi:hypothetical protein